MKPTKRLFNKPAPFAMGQAKRATEHEFLAWLERTENKMIGNPDSLLPKLPAGWYIEADVLPGIEGGRFASIAPTPIFWLRRGIPPPPRMPRDRCGDRPESDAELRARGKNPADYLPGPAKPPYEFTDWWAIWVLAALAGLFLSIWIPAQK